ncbi:glycosyltransferase family 4 protein [uncultured Sphaerochaeta sp.]|uniref:glycosyltransferase family 4 protein n=1 Tax=uncultured Sphaerochaeta sp. TaxID=886478 RepID=UPI002AA6292F|nr:glycosyltransferase family 4 protein [uncultured Sphaerochaeta sp.]
MMNKTILILSNDVDYLYTLRLETIERLLKEGFSVSLSAPSNERVEFFEQLGCTFYPTEFTPRGKNPVSNLALLLKYVRLIKQVQPHVVLTYTIKANIYGGLVCRMLYTPQVANMTGLGKALMGKGVLQSTIQRLLRIAFKRASTVFLQNERDLNYFLDHKITNKEQSVLIPGSGVNLARHPLEEYPEDDGTIRLIFIARIIKDKGIEEMMAAAIKIHQMHPNVTCNIAGFIGEDEYAAQLKAYGETGAGSYLGFQKDIHALIKSSHAVVLPSYHLEGIANVLLEGAACGRPVLSTNHIGCRETFDDGVSGIMFEPRSTEALSKAIEKFVTIPYEKKREMGLAGRKKVEKEFNRQVIVEAYMRAIEKVAVK